MKLITNKMNNTYLRSILPNENHEVDGVFAAIAYGSLGNNEKEDLIGNCLSNEYRLDIWMRYDHTVPVSVPMLKRILRSHNNNIFCKLIPDCLHSKVIWWKGYGAYIGSANLTDRAWLTNIEAGLFLTEEELVSNNMDTQLESFFDNLRDIDESFPLTQEIIDEMEKISKLRGGFDDRGKELRSQEVWNNPSFFSKPKAADKQKQNFQKEWTETLTILRKIGEKLSEDIPSWVDPSTPIGWQTDQFLHAYYYNHVSEGRKRPFETFHQNNRANPKAALDDKIEWWRNTKEPPSNEDRTFVETAPYIQKHLSKERVLNLTLNEFAPICGYTHATVDHIAKVSPSLFGKDPNTSIPIPQRIEPFAEWLLKQKNSMGWDIRKLLHYVLYEGKDDQLWERLYNAGRDEKYKFPHYGLNSIAEVVGWTRPDLAPPRNGRTSKALRALGYDVRIY